MDEVKKYLSIVRLIDGTEIIQNREYNWCNYESELNDARNKFIKIEEKIFNKECIKYIEIVPNPDYEEPKQDDVI